MLVLCLERNPLLHLLAHRLTLVPRRLVHAFEDGFLGRLHEGVVGPNTCLAGFQCSDAFPTGADLAPLAEAAAALEAEFESAECTDCRDDVACEDPTVLRAE